MATEYPFRWYVSQSDVTGVRSAARALDVYKNSFTLRNTTTVSGTKGVTMNVFSQKKTTMMMSTSFLALSSGTMFLHYLYSSKIPLTAILVDDTMKTEQFFTFAPSLSTVKQYPFQITTKHEYILYVMHEVDVSTPLPLRVILFVTSLAALTPHLNPIISILENDEGSNAILEGIYRGPIQASQVSSNVSSGILPISVFPTSGVSPGTYGGSNLVPVLSVDAWGRVQQVTPTEINVGRNYIHPWRMSPSAAHLWMADNIQPTVVPSTLGALSNHAASNALIHREDDQIDYHVHVTADVLSTSSTPSSAEFLLSLPYPVKTASYVGGTILGQLHSRIENHVTSEVFHYPATVRTHATNSNHVVVRALAGNHEVSLGTLGAQTQVQLTGNFTYITTTFPVDGTLLGDLVYIDSNQTRLGINTTQPEHTLDVRGSMMASNIYFTGQIFQNGQIFKPGNDRVSLWETTSNAPVLLTTNGGFVGNITAGPSNAYVRHADDHVDYYLDMENTVIAQALLPTDYMLSLAKPVDISKYAPEAVLGEMYGRIITPDAEELSFPILVRVNNANSNNAILRIWTGNNEETLGSLPGGSVLRVTGSFQYITTAFSVDSLYSRSLLYLDTSNLRVGVNTSSPLATMDVQGDLRASNLYFHGRLFQNGVPIFGSNPIYVRPWEKVNQVLRYLAPSTTILSYAANSNALIRRADNQIDYYVQLATTILRPPIVSATDFYLPVPYPIQTAYYVDRSVLGDMVAEVTVGTGAPKIYPVTVRTNTPNSNVVLLRLCSNQSEVSFSTLTSNTQVRLMGTFQYVTTTIPADQMFATGITYMDMVRKQVGINTPTPGYTLDVQGDINFTGSLLQNGVLYAGGSGSGGSLAPFLWNPITSNVGLYTGSNPTATLDIHGSLQACNLNVFGEIYKDGVPLTTILSNITPAWTSNTFSYVSNWQVGTHAPTFKIPHLGMADYSTTSNMAYRLDDNDVHYSLDMEATLISPPLLATGDFHLSLPFPIHSGIYPDGALLGELVAKITRPTSPDIYYYTVHVRYTSSESHHVVVRFLNGTNEESLSVLTTDSVIHLTGSFHYATSAVPMNPILVNRGLVLDLATGNVGYNTTTPHANLDIQGDINLSGQLLSNGIPLQMMYGSNGWPLQPWQQTTFPPRFTVFYTGSNIYTPDYTSMYRHVDDQVDYHVNVTCSVRKQPIQSSDYLLSIPLPLRTSLYLDQAILGELHAKVSDPSNGNVFNYTVVVRVKSSDSGRVIVRLLSGTTELPLSTLSAGSVLQLSGNFSYATTSYAVDGFMPSNFFYQDLVGNLGIGTQTTPARLSVNGSGSFSGTVTASNINILGGYFLNGAPMCIGCGGGGGMGGGMLVLQHPWTPTDPELQVLTPIGGVVSALPGTLSRYRYEDDDVAVNLDYTATVLVQPPSGDFFLTVPFPVKTSSYTTDTVLGELYMRVVFAGTTNHYPVMVYSHSTDDRVKLRMLSGTTETSFQSLLAGTQFHLTGTFRYTTLDLADGASNVVSSTATFFSEGFRIERAGGVFRTPTYYWKGVSNIQPQPTSNEPMTRLSVAGLDATLFTGYFKSPLYDLFAVGTVDLHVSAPLQQVRAPWNYVRMRLPVDTTTHGMYFQLVRSANIIQAMEAWVCDPVTGNPTFRLQGRTINGVDSTVGGDPLTVTSFLGPYNQSALEQKGRYEWLQFSVPMEAVTQYKNSSNELQIAYNRLQISTDAYAYTAGYAYAANPYGVSFISAGDLFSAANGGSYFQLGSWLWKAEAYAILQAKSRRDNLVLPICDCFDTYVMLVLHQTEETMIPNVYLELAGTRFRFDRFTLGRSAHRLSALHLHRTVIGTRVPSIYMTQHTVQIGLRDYLKCSLVNEDSYQPVEMRGIITELVA